VEAGLPSVSPPLPFVVPLCFVPGQEPSQKNSKRIFPPRGNAAFLRQARLSFFPLYSQIEEWPTARFSFNGAGGAMKSFPSYCNARVSCSLSFLYRHLFFFLLFCKVKEYEKRNQRSADPEPFSSSRKCLASPSAGAKDLSPLSSCRQNTHGPRLPLSVKQLELPAHRKEYGPPFLLPARRNCPLVASSARSAPQSRPGHFFSSFPRNTVSPSTEIGPDPLSLPPRDIEEETLFFRGPPEQEKGE